MQVHAEHRGTAYAKLHAADSIGTHWPHCDDDDPRYSSRHEGMREDRERVIDILPDMRHYCFVAQSCHKQSPETHASR
jgi:hypothetical protein